MVVAKRPKFQNQGPAWRCKHRVDKDTVKHIGWLSCTAYSMAMGIDFATGGATHPTGCEVRAHTKDFVKGLNLSQVARVADEQFHVRVTVRTGRHAIAPEKAAEQITLGRGFVLQGNTEALRHTEFQSTGVGANHAVWVSRVRGGTPQRPKEARVFDPAADGRVAAWGTSVRGPSWWPWDTVLAFGAALRLDDNGRKLGPGRLYAGFVPLPAAEEAAVSRMTVNRTEPDTKVVMAPGAVRTKPFPDRVRANPPAGRRVNVRRDPASLSPKTIVDRLSDGMLFIAFQKVTNGAKPAGSNSRTWYGNRDGTEWIHETGLRRIGGNT